MVNGKNISAIILAAGRSTRMGAPKLSLRFDPNTTFLQKLVNEYHSFACIDIVVVVNAEVRELLVCEPVQLPCSVTLVVNLHPDWERFYSLKLGAKTLRHICPVFISNIDNPFVNQTILGQLLDHGNDADYVYPACKGRGGHPFLLSANAVSQIVSEEKDQVHLKEFLKRFSRHSVEIDDERILANINEETEFKKFFG
jgi:CTP:molybdopterin cytidylyltransferase MocA